MSIIKNDKEIILQDFHYFNATNILECGQIFRYKKTEEGYECYSQRYRAAITGEGTRWRIICDNVDYFYNFFDLDRDYSVICNKLRGTSEAMSRAIEYGKGIRILNQDLFETLICFIISANNNIKRIQGIVERLCTAYGERTDWGYAFPTPSSLAKATEQELLALGLGYRARYVAATARRVAEGYKLDNLLVLDSCAARKELNSFLGVGNKVADCVILFGLHKQDCFPVDTWMEKVYHAYFEGGLPREKISDFFVNYFGEYAGFAQQYLFYYQREGNFSEKV